MIEQSDWFVLVLTYLFKLVILAMFLERALYFLFDYKFWREFTEKHPIRSPISFALAWVIVNWYDLDILAPTLDPGSGPTDLGIFVTALIVAGGSAGAIKLFQDFLKLGRTTQEESRAFQKAQHEAELENIKARQRILEAEAQTKEAEAKIAKAKAP